MSRYRIKPTNFPNITICYGFDPVPMGGYFVQVFDETKVSDQNDEGIILNEGMCPGISHGKMSEIMSELVDVYGINPPSLLRNHLMSIALDIEI